MSVVVRMEMPESCEKCPACDYEDGNCLLADDRNTFPHNGKRKLWCPILCQLPEGHGRLVDKDEILKKSKGKYGDFEITAVAMEFYGSPIIVPTEAERSET